jgi:hypothetical protein
MAPSLEPSDANSEFENGTEADDEQLHGAENQDGEIGDERIVFIGWDQLPDEDNNDISDEEHDETTDEENDEIHDEDPDETNDNDPDEIHDENPDEIHYEGLDEIHDEGFDDSMIEDESDGEYKSKRVFTVLIVLNDNAESINADVLDEYDSFEELTDKYLRLLEANDAQKLHFRRRLEDLRTRLRTRFRATLARKNARILELERLLAEALRALEGRNLPRGVGVVSI